MWITSRKILLRKIGYNVVMRSSNLSKLIVSIFVSGVAGAIGTGFTFSAIPNWYAHLARPDLSPPNWIFGPVWTTLYVLMGISLFLVWKRGFSNKEVGPGVVLFSIQLVMNAFWSIVFFGGHSPLAGMVVIAILWFAILFTMIQFSRVSKAAAWLLVPYILWVSFASYLNFMILIMN